MKDPKNPYTTSIAHDEMSPRWNLIDSLLGGTRTMREAGERYLPKHPAETDEQYRERLDCNVLYNMTKKTLSTLVGKPFSDPVKIEVPEALEPLLQDVDLLGNNHEVFARTWFAEGMAKGYSHVLVDFPRVEGPRTLDDDRREGLRPYWVQIRPERVLDIRSTVINGVQTLTHVRILEETSESVGFTTQNKVRIRVMEPGITQIWAPKDPTKLEEEWFVEDEWQTGQNYIPLVTFFASQTDNYICDLPLEDLAHLNVSHWQSNSDQRHILTVSRFPMLAASGVDPNDSSRLVVGPNKVLFCPDSAGRFYFVETTGKSIEAGREDLLALEHRMSQYGASFLEKKPGDQTATAKAIDSADANSELSAIVLSFEDALANVLWYTADWLNLNEGGKVELVKDYAKAMTDQPKLDALAKARGMRDISRQAYVSQLKAGGVLDEDYDADADQEALDEEALSSETDLDPTSTEEE